MKYTVVLLGLCLATVCGCRSYDDYVLERCQPKEHCRDVGVNAQMCYTPEHCYIIKHKGKKIGECEYAELCKFAIDNHYDELNRPTVEEKLSNYGIKVVDK